MSVKLRAVIVDDVAAAIDNLRQTLDDFVEEVEVVDTADSVVSGAKLIKEVKPDIAFLDIEMPDGSGFDLIDLLPDNLETRVIFTTGSEAYALKAFRYAAVDYLLKPIDPDDLIAAVHKAKNGTVTTGVVRQVLQDKDVNGIPRKIALHTSDEVIVIDIKDIVRCQSLDNYCHIHLSSGEKVLMSKPLKHYADLLEDADFIRVHQSHLVNYNFVHSFVKKEGGYLMLKDDTQIPVSLRKRAELLDRMS
jgi:two-component system LytT family response regulator